MSQPVRLFGMLSIAVLLCLGACAPAPEPPAEEEPPPPAAAPEPEPTLYDLTEADIVADEPDFTSRNITVLGFKLGDETNKVSGETLGPPGDTATLTEEYLTDYRDGGVRVHTFKMTGLARRIEVTTTFAARIASPPLRAWLEDGDVEAMRELMGPEQEVEETDTGATEYVYDDRGIRFVEYPDNVYGIRFSQTR